MHFVSSFRRIGIPALLAAALLLTAGPARTFTAAKISPPPNVGRAVQAAIAYHDSGAYLADSERVGRAALRHLEERMAAPAEGRPVIVLDVDETSLSNWTEMKRLNLGFNHEQWDAWADTGRAPAIDPTLALARRAAELGAGVVFITGRTESLRRATEANLKRAGYSKWTMLIMRPDGDRRPADIYKTEARAALEKGGHTVILNMGDQDSDLVGGHAEAVFKLPNPFYWIPVGY